MATGAEVWPCHPGLRAAGRRDSIHSIKKARTTFPIHLGSPAIASPIGVDGLLVVSLANGDIELLSEYSGKRFGRLTAPDEIVVTPAISAGSLFVAAGPGVHCYDVSRYLDRSSDRHQTPVWSFECNGGAPAHPVLVDEQTVYLIAQDGNTATLHALSQSEGRPVWNEFPRIESGPTMAPLLVNDYIVVISLAGDVFLVNRSDGIVEPSFHTRREVNPQVTPFVERDRIVLTDKNHRVFEIIPNSGGGPLINEVYAMRARITSLAASADFIAVGHMAGLTLLDGRGGRRWSADDIDPVSVTPIVAGDTVFALDDAGNGLLFNALKSNPIDKARLFGANVGPPPLITRTHIAAVSTVGDVVAIEYRPAGKT